MALRLRTDSLNKVLKKTAMVSLSFILTASCGDDVFLDEALQIDDAPMEDETEGYFASGDIVIVSGGAVASTNSPYPLHMITHWSRDGEFIRVLAQAPSPTTYYYAVDLDFDATTLYFTVDTVDRVEKIDLETLTTTTHVIDANLAGNTIRAVAALSDGGIVVAESTTSIEKFDANGLRVTTNFPFTVSANINHIRRISGDRFVVLFTGGTDNPRVYDNDGTLLTSLTGLPCGTNCDPNDIIELPDGRFVVSYNIASMNSLELFDSDFTHIGQLFKDTTILPLPGAMSVLENGNLIVCTTAINTCEQIEIDGEMGVRVGARAFISDASLMRQPTWVVVVP